MFDRVYFYNERNNINSLEQNFDQYKFSSKLTKVLNRLADCSPDLKAFVY